MGPSVVALQSAGAHPFLAVPTSLLCFTGRPGSQVTGDGSQGSHVKPIGSSTGASDQLVLAASLTSLGDFQGNSSVNLMQLNLLGSTGC